MKNYPIATVVAAYQILLNTAKLANRDKTEINDICSRFAKEILEILPRKYYAVRFSDDESAFPEIGIFDDKLSRDDWLSEILDEDDVNGTADYVDFMKDLACGDSCSICCYHLVDDYVIFTVDEDTELKAVV